MGWGKGKGHPHFRHPHRPGLAVVAAEAAVVGGVTAAVLGRKPPPRPPPRTEVVVVQAQPAPVYAQPAPAQPVQAVPVVQPAVAVVQPAVPVAVAPAPRVWKGKGKGKGKAVIVSPVQPLSVARASLPADGMEERGGTVYFAIVVTPEQGEPWRVMRRYKEFDHLCSRLAPTSTKFLGAPFPPKNMLGAFKELSGQKLEDRRRGLETWLQRAIADPLARGPWIRPLRDFLEDGRVFLRAAPMAAAPPAAPPPAAAPPSAAGAPSSAPSAPPMDAAPPAEDEGLVLQIVIPEGVGPGIHLGVEVPEVGQVTFEIPQGVAPGAELQLWYDSSSSTLTPLT